MSNQEILDNLAEAIVDGDETAAAQGAKLAIDQGVDALEAVDQGLAKGMAVVGQRFETGEAFLPELLMAAETFNAAMAVLNPVIEANKQQTNRLGTFLLATVKGISTTSARTFCPPFWKPTALMSWTSALINPPWTSSKRPKKTRSTLSGSPR